MTDTVHVSSTAITKLPTHAWDGIADAVIIDRDRAERALCAMEISPTRFLAEQRPAAERLATWAGLSNEPDLHLRAQLVLAGIVMRLGDVTAAAGMVRSVRGEAEAQGDAFSLARCCYLSAWIAFFVGNRPSAQMDAMRSIELLSDDAHVMIRVGHLIMVGNAFSDSADGHQYFEQALDLVTDLSVGDSTIDRSAQVTIYNNMAYALLERGEVGDALNYVEKMIATSRVHAYPLGAVHWDTIGRAYLLDGQYERVIEVLEPIRAVAAAEAPADAAGPVTEPHALPAGLLTLAEAYRALGAFESAQHVLDLGLGRGKVGGMSLLDPGFLQEQSRLHAAQGRFAEAYRVHIEYLDAVLASKSAEEQTRALVVKAAFESRQDRRSAEHYRELAMRDALTGLRNRRFLDQVLATEVAAAASSGAPLSLAIADCDFFKRVNDEQSHAVGDIVLKTLATLLATLAPAGASVCRLGGEEFVLVMPGLEDLEAFDICEQLRQSVASFDWEGTTHSIPITVSVGVTTAAQGRTSASALLADADRNLYAAKRSGRNRVMGDVR